MFEDYYKTVQLHPECDAVLIPEMRRIWAKLIHPDIAKTAIERTEFTDKIQRINHAIDILSDPQLRNDYNKNHPYFTAKVATKAKPEPEHKPEPERTAKPEPCYAYKSDISAVLRKYLDSEILFNIAKEAKAQNKLDSFGRRAFYNFGQRVKQHQKFTPWQIENFSKYIAMAQKAGLI